MIMLVMNPPPPNGQSTLNDILPFIYLAYIFASLCFWMLIISELRELRKALEEKKGD